MASEVDGSTGSIEQFDPEDSIGTLVLDDGTRVRFGATACKGFLPAVGARVRLAEARPHPRHGLKAKRVELLDSEVEHHARTAKAYGLKQPTAAELRSSATLLGWVTVLLDSPLPTTERELNDLGRSLGIDARFAQDPNGDLRIETNGRSVMVYAVPEPIEDRRLDLSRVGPDFPRGRAYVSLSLGMSDVARKLRRLNPDVAPPVEEVTRIVAALCRLGPGVVLDLAEGLVISADDFVRRSTGDPARLWSALSVGHGQRYMRSRGMGMLGAPEVAMRLAGESFDHEAAVLAGLCGDLARGWVPVSGETLTYDGGATYRMFELGSGWWVMGDHPEEAQAAHHAAMWLGAAERFIMRRVGYVDGLENSAPPHFIDVFSGLGTAMITNGLSLGSQPGGSMAEGNERVELMVRLDRDDSVHARMLSMFGGMMFDQQGDRPFRPWDGLRNAPDTGFPPELETLILVPREPLVIWPGHETSVFELVAVSADEYMALRGNHEAGDRWLSERKRQRDWSGYRARFNAFLR